MYSTLQPIHTWTGYAVFVLVVAVGVWGVSRSKAGREFTATPFSVTMVALDLQVTLGIVLYVIGEGWDFDAPIAYFHPAAMLAALAVGHIGVARARRENMVDAAHRLAGRGLLVAAVLVAAGIGVASAA